MPRRTPARRLQDIVLSLDIGDVPARLIETAEPWMVDDLRRAEAAVRRLRVQIEQKLSGEGRVCANGACKKPIAGRADRRYCSDRCRQDAHRSRHRPKVIGDARVPSLRRGEPGSSQLQA